MRITRKFLQLTKYTNPHGTEHLVKTYLPEHIKTDSYGNYFYVIGESPTTMFTCHLDTVGIKRERVKHVFDGDIIKTDGKTILGADDKAGMLVLLYMIENNVPGVYYFFVGEEVGCVGSRKVSTDYANSIFVENVTKVVSFDRRGDSSIITHQWGGRCCSDEFGDELANRLNSTGFGLKMDLDRTGILTDSAQFMDIIPECTNISVGYKYEHTMSEYQDIDYLKRLCKAVCAIDWETLPVKRDPFDIKDDYSYGSRYGFNIDDEEYAEEFYSYFKDGDSSKKMYIAKSVVREEATLIKLYLLANGYDDLEDIIWNGHTLYVYTKYVPRYEFVGDRYTLMDFIPELSSVMSDKLRTELPIKSTIYDDDFDKYIFYQ